MPRVYLGLGSNLGDRVALLRDVVHRLQAVADVSLVDASRLYESEPWEIEAGPSARRTGT
jgi:7,8-dihydro-6-hydroxymethylpterin-pyrophosphokinase